MRLMKTTAVGFIRYGRRRSDRIITVRFVSSRASTELIVRIRRDFDVRNNVYKPRRLRCECYRDISIWKSRVMKPNVLRVTGRMKPTLEILRKTKTNQWAWLVTREFDLIIYKLQLPICERKYYHNLLYRGSDDRHPNWNAVTHNL